MRLWKTRHAPAADESVKTRVSQGRPRRHRRTDSGRHKGDYSGDVQAGERRQRFFLADGFFAAGFLDLDFLDLDGRPALSGGATTVLMTPRR